MVAHRTRAEAGDLGALGRGELAARVELLDDGQPGRVGERADRPRIGQLDRVTSGHDLKEYLDAFDVKQYFRNMSFTSARRDVHLVAAAKSVSWLGDEVALVALLLHAQGAGRGAGTVAGLLIANTLPLVLLSGVVGRLVDRVDNRLLLAGSRALAQARAVRGARVRPRPPRWRCWRCWRCSAPGSR